MDVLAGETVDKGASHAHVWITVHTYQQRAVVIPAVAHNLWTNPGDGDVDVYDRLPAYPPPVTVLCTAWGVFWGQRGVGVPHSWGQIRGKPGGWPVDNRGQLWAVAHMWIASRFTHPVLHN